jgi:hypothetical protein
MTGVWHHAQLLSVEMESFFLPVLAWNHDPPNLSLLHSWDDKHMPLYPAIG